MIMVNERGFTGDTSFRTSCMLPLSEPGKTRFCRNAPRITVMLTQRSRD